MIATNLCITAHLEVSHFGEFMSVDRSHFFYETRGTSRELEVRGCQN